MNKIFTYLELLWHWRMALENGIDSKPLFQFTISPV